MIEKKEFTQTAKILYDEKASDQEIGKFANMYAKMNPRFDRDRFYQASKQGKIFKTPKKYWV